MRTPPCSGSVDEAGDGGNDGRRRFFYQPMSGALDHFTSDVRCDVSGLLDEEIPAGLLPGENQQRHGQTRGRHLGEVLGVAFEGAEVFEAGPHDAGLRVRGRIDLPVDRKSTRLNSSHLVISYAVFCLKKKKKKNKLSR